MICSECGKKIEDEAVICPKCGAVTEKGVSALKESAKQGASVDDNQMFTTLKSKDNSKIIRLVAMIFGLVGSVILLCSLLGEFCSITVPIFGKYGVSISKYLDKMIILVFILAGVSILSSLLRYSVVQIFTGSASAVCLGYMIWEIKSRASSSEVSGFVDINFGAGVYLFILAVCLILTSGILFVVAAKKSQAQNEKMTKSKVVGKYVSICLVICIICVVGIFIVLRNNQLNTYY